MERKQHFQFEKQAKGSLRILGQASAREPFAAVVLEAKGKTLRLSSPAYVTPGTPVSIDIEGGLVLAEVTSSPGGAEGYELEVVIDQVIPSVSDLANLMNAIMDAGSTDRRRVHSPGRRA